MSGENSGTGGGARLETIGIKGMRCKSCSDSIESRIKDMDGVREIKVDLIKNMATVKYDPSVTDSERIKSEINALGYATGDCCAGTAGAAGAVASTVNSGGGKRSNYMEGVIYGLVPHIGCIAFIVASILGVTVLMNAFKPLLMNRYFFHILIIISASFATISSALYLRKNGLLSFAGAKRKWQYLSTMYGTTLGINLLLFFLIFPMLANVTAGAPLVTGGAGGIPDGSTLKLSVDIPCSGHAPLITGELKSIDGVSGVQFSFPNIFDVTYDPAKTSKDAMLALDVFKEYPAKVLGEGAGQEGLAAVQSSPLPAAPGSPAGGCGCGGCASGSCGGAGSARLI